VNAVVLVATAGGLVAALPAWLVRTGSRKQIVISAVMLIGLLVAGLVVLTGDGVGGWRESARDVLLLLAGLLAIFGGGPLTTSVLALVDRGSTPALSTQQAGEVLRGGALIGTLERGAIFAGLLAGWPEAMAVVLAIKGLARYPELRGPDQSTMPVTPHAVAERFIIGTFVSVLWSVTCASLLLS